MIGKHAVYNMQSHLSTWIFECICITIAGSSSVFSGGAFGIRPLSCQLLESAADNSGYGPDYKLSEHAVVGN